MRGSARHYATRLLAPQSFHSFAGCNSSGQAARGRSRGQVLAVIEFLNPQRLGSSTSFPQPGLPAPLVHPWWPLRHPCSLLALPMDQT